MLNQNRREDSDAVLDERVSALLQAAAAPCEPGPLPGEDAALATFRAAHDSSRRSSMLTTLTSLKTGLAAALGAGVLLTGGVGMAAAGALPGGAQDSASDLLAKVGVTVPQAGEKSAEEQERTASDDADDDATTSEGADSSEKGQEVSEFARSTDLEGEEKGAAVSDLASEGRSKAGDERDERGEDAPAGDDAAASEKRDGAGDHAAHEGDDAVSGGEGREGAKGAADDAGETDADADKAEERADRGADGESADRR